MGGSVVAFGLHSVCQIFVFFILTLFVVDNKMVGNTVCWFEIFKGSIWDIQSRRKLYDYTKIKKACCALCKIC